MSDELQPSQADVWHLKPITFQGKTTKIITQNFNGPCSFIAICNILILRGNIEILPADRTTVSYELLAPLVGEYLLQREPGADIDAALSVMPCTQRGMDLNPLFTSPRGFRPAGDGGELQLFAQVGIELVHGWLVDPASAASDAVSRAADYDSAVNAIVAADHIAKGALVGDAPPPPDLGKDWTDAERASVEDALVLRRFLHETSSQLTYHGLFTLAGDLPRGALVALFRNSHLAVLHRPDALDAPLYSLVTDQVFLREPSVVWERLEDVDGGASSFVDAEFAAAAPVGGDFAGQTAEDAVRAAEMHAAQFAVVDPADHALAQQLQAEEDDLARRERAALLEQQQQQQDVQRQHATAQSTPPPLDAASLKKKLRGKKSDCIIM